MHCRCPHIAGCLGYQSVRVGCDGVGAWLLLSDIVCDCVCEGVADSVSEPD
jgi:hypothetical protein